MTMCVRLGVLVLAIIFIQSAHGSAQGVERVVVSEPTATFPEPFSSVSGLRELSDGRVLVSDRIEQSVRLIDPAAGRSRQVGRTGEGPGEYRMPGLLLPMPGDSTLVIDIGNSRMTMIGPGGTMDRSIPMIRPNGSMVRPVGTDSAGRLYFETRSIWVHRPGDPPGGAPRDSMPVALWDPRSDEVDTLCRVSMRGRERIRQRRGETDLRRFFPPAFAARDAWAVGPDGRIALVISNDYHVEWVGSDQGRVVGPGTSYEPVPITRREKESWAERVGAGNVMAISGEPDGGSRTERIPAPDIDEIAWPEFKPPFESERVWSTPDGELWVGLFGRAGEAQLYDVFNAAGARVRKVFIPPGRRLVGFGNRTLYAVYSDEDDLQWLERYSR